MPLIRHENVHTDKFLLTELVWHQMRLLKASPAEHIRPMPPDSRQQQNMKELKAAACKLKASCASSQAQHEDRGPAT
ncbi:MAG: hypothetical protein FRX49_01732 [Trebouxia sp. A1-2]|nr:MAG: hypothetical protein FRX49_01732 [Trebouxia sp. A1-2]